MTEYPDPELRNIVVEELAFGQNRSMKEIARRVADRTHDDLMRKFYVEALERYISAEAATV